MAFSPRVHSTNAYAWGPLMDSPSQSHHFWAQRVGKEDRHSVASQQKPQASVESRIMNSPLGAVRGPSTPMTSSQTSFSPARKSSPATSEAAGRIAPPKLALASPPVRAAGMPTPRSHGGSLEITAHMPGLRTYSHASENRPATMRPSVREDTPSAVSPQKPARPARGDRSILEVQHPYPHP